MKKGLTEMVFVLYRSGSMCGLEKDTVGGFNSMMNKQKETEGEAIVTTVLVEFRECECMCDVGGGWKEKIEADYKKRGRKKMRCCI